MGVANYSLPWFGTLRGRVGVVPWERFLLYVTGVAVGEVKADYADAIGPGVLTPLTIATASVNQTRVGWVAGAGIEGAAWWNNWTWKIEYLHMDLGSVGASPTGLTTGSLAVNIGDFRTTLTQSIAFNSAFHARFTDDIIRVGLNYRFGYAATPVVSKY